MNQLRKDGVKRIIALHPFPKNPSGSQEMKLRVAAYCRVSSASDEQLISYQNQILYYKELIESQPGQALVGIFADEGISGTDTRKRDAFNQMMQAAREGKIDRVITKSLSRFGRNTLDCLQYIRELKALGIDVYFEKENLHTLNAQGEMILTMIAAIAQNESLNQSENVKWGIRRQYERGNVHSVQSSKFLGYKKEKNGYLVIDEEKAKTVRRIYQLFLDGFGINQIATMLTKENVPMAYGGKAWSTSTIKKILTNEKFMGDTLFQKTFNSDFLTKHRVKNSGHLPQYYVENTHEAIIDRETWALVQKEFTRQRQFAKDHFLVRYHSHSRKIPLCGKIICSQCGRTFGIRKANQIIGDNRKHWICVAAADKACSMTRRLDSEWAEHAFVMAWNSLCSQRDRLNELPAEDELKRYRQEQLQKLLAESGPIEALPYELMLKVLDRIEVHEDVLTVIFLSGHAVRIDFPAPEKPMPRWTHTSKPRTRMAQRRMELGLTQLQLANLADIARSHLNRIENGFIDPLPKTQERLSAVLGIPCDAADRTV